ncbi:TauD/TfdA family dioxygenase [Ammoniphilus sp. 3BR4]|uniref:TauD/TfdA family dioxygenase n=1 Tax=Ammoniphilus sp. 3BR4 TaxID=3158265 RepID=UPI00346532B3
MVEEITITLKECERNHVESLIQKLPPLDIRSITDEVMTEVIMIGREIKDTIARKLIEFRRSSNPYGTLVIRNLPVDRMLPPTPSDGGASPAKFSFLSEYCLLMIMLFFGEPISYEEEKEGLLIQNICPVKGKESKQENTGSNQFFKFHTEDAIHPYKPDHLGLICLRADHEQKAKTLTASILRALPYLPSTAVTLLRKPLYRLYAPSSFIKFGSERYSTVIPILTGSLLSPHMCVHLPTMEGINREAQWALEALQAALCSVAEEFVLLPGDMLIIDNRFAAHARTSFQARYDGNDRWLQRMFTVEDFRRTSFSRGSKQHKCTPLFIEEGLRNEENFNKINAKNE